jgi:peptidoglycan/xylan/chitin deacetylase (PgdA/CDA1 family)
VIALAGVAVVAVAAGTVAAALGVPSIAPVATTPDPHPVAAAPSPTASSSATPPLPSPSMSGPAASPVTGSTCPAPPGVEPAAVAFHGPRTAKVVALTFDDGTNAPNTLRILATLKKYRVNATFFPTGRAMELYPDVWRRVAAAHFPIANHTYAHRQLRGLCFEAQRDELEKGNAVFTALDVPELHAGRPPYEAFDETTLLAATSAGLSEIVLWDVDTKDWEGRSASAIVHAALAGGRGSIVLMHTFPAATAKALPAIIRGYRARGFRFVTVGQLLDLGGPVAFR